MPKDKTIAVIVVVALLSSVFGAVIMYQWSPAELTFNLDPPYPELPQFEDLARGLSVQDRAHLEAASTVYWLTLAHANDHAVSTNRGRPFSMEQTVVSEGDRLTNERTAIRTLESIHSAQEYFKSLRALDLDEDGNGEYGYIAELAGAAHLRAWSGCSGQVLSPAILSPSFGRFEGFGCVERRGYCYKVYLPSKTHEGRIGGLREGAYGGSQGGDKSPDHKNAEKYWCAYAWPSSAGRTGTRAFFINQEGHLLEASNSDHAYDGPNRAPVFDAAFSDQGPKNMCAPLPLSGDAANDGKTWLAVCESP